MLDNNTKEFFLAWFGNKKLKAITKKPSKKASGLTLVLENQTREVTSLSNFAIYDFTELLNCFCSNQLDSDKNYFFSYSNTKVSAKIAQKDGKITLKTSLTINEVETTQYLEKYECKVILAKLHKLLNVVELV